MFRNGVLAVVVLLVAASGALADTVNADYVNVSPGESGKIWILGYFGSGVSTRIGQYNFVSTDGTDVPQFLNADGTPGKPFYGYDMEGQYLNPPSNWTVKALEDAPSPNYPDPNGMGMARANRLRELFGEHYPTGADPVFTNAEAAGFAMAVFEIVYEAEDATSYEVRESETATRGNFYAQYFSTAAFGAAAGYLGTIPDAGGTLATGLFALVDPNGQDFVVAIPGGDTQEVVPVPGAAWSGIGLLVVLGVIRRSRRQRA